jgi:hypothetical protein
MKDTRNTQRMLVEKPGRKIKFIGPMTRNKKAMKEENEFLWQASTNGVMKLQDP